ncbi:LCP family protein [Enterococcus sp. BWR-S5]|uniref:LCP family protein n=1 Tax=Enterococcus sp. BWR-S5 TaxID=2787714 RepID=UPI0019209294|nr:LCP family protein [Enterococcus sp. BWR-S5]MBL1226051.1 LCP family protein [Enterococcus sp. BWR-S5]
MNKLWKWLVTGILSFVLVGMMIFCYSVISFHKGKRQSQTQVNTKKNESFSGDERTETGEITILLIGDDGRDEDEDGGRADTLMVANYNTATKEPKVLSIMRDAYVDVPGVGMDKINAAYAYGGAGLTKDVLNETFGLPINYYAAIDFNIFTKLIDDFFPDGVQVNAETALELDGVEIEPGEQIMDGNTLLQYARFRMDEEGDFGRVRRQQQVADCLIKQAKSGLPITQLPRLLGEAIGYVDTDVPYDILLDVGKNFLFGQIKELQTLSVPVEGSWSFNDYTPSGSVLEIDAWENRLAIEAFLANGEGQ